MIIPNEIKDEYARKRAYALEVCEERRRAVYAMIPRLEQIAFERRQLLFDMGLKLRVSEDKDGLRNDVMSRVNLLNAEEAELCQANNIASEFLVPPFSCGECEDTGFVGVVNKRMCKCLKRRLLERQYASSHITDGESFETFDLSVFKDEKQKKLMESVERQALLYSDSFPNNDRHDMLIMGNAGLGKTFLLNCIAKRVSDRGFGVLKLTSYNLVNNVLKSMRGEVFDFISPDLLVIDDLGTEPMIPNVTREHLFATINERQNASRATVTATNFSLSELQDIYGERLFSRLIAPRVTLVIKLCGKNVRMTVR